MDRLIQRIATALSANVPFSEIHDTIVNGSPSEPCTEEDFFLAYHAAEILLNG